ncbi:sulfurtransferase complex subunit TusC [Candidatus Erwinia haradaeae]|uniref:Protein TusC n=1 Tax=Candidatus Erwinia haradaeae TaxID=1922217 RepID=A0A451DLJ1_9GAMM|nr:sulfurtransferase complex subunit TusC [Candidatus Erwinia haradaeae]VFP87596.1 Protein TusC [Candidatus Erwinia haradaeae]
MNDIAFVFTQCPHGSSSGREGLDAVLAALTLTKKIGLFFVSDGVLQLLPGQNSNVILARNYSVTFGVLPLYDITQFYVCAAALEERGIPTKNQFLIKVHILFPRDLRIKLNDYDQIITF